METNRSLTPNWSSLAWRGFASILFGILALAWPGITLAALALMFGAYAFADGVFALIFAFRRDQEQRWLLVVDGLLGIGAGLLTLLWPGLTLLALIFVIGARALIMGGFQIAAAFKLRRVVPSPIILGIAGVASLVLGIFAFVMPGVTAYALVTMLGVYALVFGVTMLVFAARLRHETHRRTPGRFVPAT